MILCHRPESKEEHITDQQETVSYDPTEFKFGGCVHTCLSVHAPQRAAKPLPELSMFCSTTAGISMRGVCNIRTQDIIQPCAWSLNSGNKGNSDDLHEKYRVHF